jgi:hypothetical protein
MRHPFVSAATLALLLVGTGGAFAQSQPATQPAQAAPNANLIPGGAAAAAPSFMDRLAYNFDKAIGRSESDQGASQNNTKTAATH